MADQIEEKKTRKGLQWPQEFYNVKEFSQKMTLSNLVEVNISCGLRIKLASQIQLFKMFQLFLRGKQRTFQYPVT